MAAEKNFENRVKKWIKSVGGWYVKYWAGGAFTSSGIPDLLSCIKGRFVAIEVKADDGEPSELQIWTVSQIRKAGGVAVILYPKAFDEFRTWAMGGFKTDKPIIMKGGQYDSRTDCEGE